MRLFVGVFAWMAMIFVFAGLGMTFTYWAATGFRWSSR